MPSLRIIALVVTLLMTLCGVARADDEDRARQLFMEGREAMNLQDYQTACDKFEESLALFRRASMLLNLGACNEELGKLATSLRYWREGLSSLQISDERVATAKEAVARLEKRAPRLQVVLPGALPPEALVALDSQATPLELLAKPIYVDPGEHHLTLDAAGHEQSRVVATAKVGKTTAVTLALGAPVAPDIVTVTSPNTTQLVVGWALGGLGVAGIAMGAITGGLVLDRKATVEEHCSDDVCTDQAGIDAAEEGRTLSVLSTAGFIAGAVFAGVGVVLIVTAAGEDDDDVALELSPRGLTLRGSF